MGKRKHLFVLAALLLAGIFLFLQPVQISLASPEPSYVKTIGEIEQDYANSVQQTADGSCVADGRVIICLTGLRDRVPIQQKAALVSGFFACFG